MIRFSAFVISACILAACSGNPFDKTEPSPAPPPVAPTPEPAPPPEPEPEPEEPTGLTGGGLATGTIVPAPDRSIVRFEERSGDTGNGSGFANNFAYASDTDTFVVEGLPFDGNQPDGTPYTRAINPTTNENFELGASFAAYEGPATTRDFVTDTEITQFEHKSIYGTTPSGDGRLAIVRTGAYAGYGFGGFVYQRDGGVVLPTSGQATYAGDYAGLRDFNGASGLEYVTGDMNVAIDFNGFSGNCTTPACTNAVRGEVTNRRVFSMGGAELTEQLAGAITEGRTTLPTLRLQIGTGALDANGEITGNVSSRAGDGTVYEAGRYYAVMSGDHTTGGEIVGVIVVEADDPRVENVTVRETGGFIVTRDPVGP